MSEDAEAYTSVFGAFPYAYRSSESRLFRSYAVLGTLIALLSGLAFVVSLMVTLADTAAGDVGTFSFSRAFIIVVGLLVVGPLIAPVLSVAHRRRHGRGDAGYEAKMGLLGYLFVLALYVGLVISAPAQYRSSVDGPLAPVVETLYGLNPLLGVVPPTAVAIAIFWVHRRGPSA